jgi:urocanate hydratase
VVIVCDGTPQAARRLQRVLWNDPDIGGVRLADGGYVEAIAAARRAGLDMPMLR